MTVRPISAEEIDLYSSIPDGVVNGCLRDHLLDQWRSGESNPGLCFLLEDDSNYYGRVSFWAIPGVPRELKIGAWYVEWNEDYLGLGSRLFDESTAQLQTAGANSIEARTFSNRTPQLEEREAVYAASGLEMVQEKRRLLFEGQATSPSEAGGIRFRTGSESSRAEFVDAFREVTRSTQDRRDALQIEAIGEDALAESRFDELVGLDPALERWLLAYKETELIGTVIPQMFTKNSGAINYIGIVPKFRGRGYGGKLLAAGTQNLLDLGVERIVAETDINNTPMLRILTEGGYLDVETVRIFEKWLS